MFSNCHVLKMLFELLRVKLYRNDLKGKKNKLLISGRYKLSRVRVTEGKITFNVLGKSTLVRVSMRFELAMVRVIGSQL